MDKNLLEKARTTRSVGLILGKPEATTKSLPVTDAMVPEREPLQFKALGVIFSRGERSDLRDLEGDKFLPDISTMRVAGGTQDEDVLRNMSTDYGLEEGYLVPGETRIPVLWDHGKGVLGKARLGWATFQKLSDEGLEFLIDIEADTVRQYDRFVEYWWEHKTLGVSSQAMSSVFDYDWNHGMIRSWWTVELSLTNKPALPTTRDELVRETRSATGDLMTPEALAKSLGITPLTEEVLMSDEVNKTADGGTPQAAPASGAPVTRSVAEELDAVVQEVAQSLDKSAEATALDAVIAILKSLNVNINDIKSRMDTLEQTSAKSADLVSLGERLDSTREDLIDGLKTSFKGLGTLLADRVKSLAVETVIEASDVELDVTKSTHQQKSAPQGHARGQGYTATGRPSSMGQ